MPFSKVKVLVNGHPIPFDMKIGEAGEAFFVFETDEDVPDELVTSPLLKPADSAEATRTEVPPTGRFGAVEHEGAMEVPCFSILFCQIFTLSTF